MMTATYSFYVDVFRALPAQFSYWFAFGLFSLLDNLFRFALSLADLIGMCHQAGFLEDSLFNDAGPKCSKDKMQAQLLLRENKYLFGWCLGRDGKPHVGFDMAETEVGGPTVVKWIPPTKDRTRKCDSKPSLSGPLA